MHERERTRGCPSMNTYILSVAMSSVVLESECITIDKLVCYFTVTSAWHY